MIKPMTLEQYLSNPAGKGSNAIVGRELILQDLERRFDVIQSNQNRKKRFNHILLKDNKGFRYVHVVVPTEDSDRENTYDVVIKFDVPEDNKDVVNDTHLRRHVIKVFSNIPSFTYTYAYVFYQNELMINELSNKYEDIVRDQAPDTRNPFYATSYEKSVVFALIYIRDQLRVVFNNTKSFDKVAVSWNRGYIDVIRHTDTIKIEYEKEKKRVRTRKRKSSGSKSGISVRSTGSKGSSAIGVNKRVGTRRTQKSAGSVRTTKTVGRRR